ncbi:hypothetical protein FQZ98_28520, partial [Escherichia coli]|uniref:hypothetical protein n=1 Tax=Escherichia coli TaxID=562 RepID=UPI00135DA33B
NFAHAYLLMGPDGIGKRLVAEMTANYIFCLNKQGKYRVCDECFNCRVQLSQNPNCRLLGYENKVGIEDIRELKKYFLL